MRCNELRDEAEETLMNVNFEILWCLACCFRRQLIRQKAAH